MTAAAAGQGRLAARAWLADLARSAAAPLACAVVLVGLLSAWVAAGGAGTVTRVRIEVTGAAVPMRGYSTASAAAIKLAPVYLTFRNLAGTPDELTGIASPAAPEVVLVSGPGPGDSAGGQRLPGPVARQLTIPAHGTLTLSPLGADAILVDPAPFERDASVQLTLTFRDGPPVTVSAAVTAPGTP
ncbi:MAG TPA: copper chaperone PCu(A)C [Trebonia sp.]|nr:copper chaperone PCu(A)C [Trebonia sp.]